MKKLVLLLMFVTTISCATEIKKHIKNGPIDRISAITAMKTFTERNLKAPSTADFHQSTFTSKPVPTDHEWNKGANTIVVSMEVDAQNGFGAMLRKRYHAVIYRGDKGLITLVHFW